MDSFFTFVCILGLIIVYVVSMFFFVHDILLTHRFIFLSMQSLWLLDTIISLITLGIILDQVEIVAKHYPYF